MYHNEPTLDAIQAWIDKALLPGGYLTRPGVDIDFFVFVLCREFDADWREVIDMVGESIREKYLPERYRI